MSGDLAPTNDSLADAYRRFRLGLTDIGRSVAPAVAAAKTPTCPAWSVKDVLAHMAGIARDILDGNIEGAATEAWADAQVSRRANDTIGQVLDEWEDTGPQIESILRNVGSQIAYQFFIDAWTHGWDIRHAIGAEPAAPEFSLAAHTVAPLLDNLDMRMTERDLGLELTLTGLPGGDRTRRVGVAVGEAPKRSLPAFDYLRLAMGRRSVRQIDELLQTADLPDGPWADAMVVWTANEQDIHDPVLR